MCEICNNESGGIDVGVASIPGVPCSIEWCSECLKQNAAPVWVFEHDFIFVAEGNLENLAPWARERVTWCDGKYVPFSRKGIRRIKQVRKIYAG
jgi:hypothetical protein